LGVGEKLWIRVRGSLVYPGINDLLIYQIWGNAYVAELSPSSFSLHTQDPQEDTIMVQTGIYCHFAMQTASTSWLGLHFPDANEHPLFYVSIYGLFGLAFALGSLFSMAVQTMGTLRASRLLFKKLLTTVVHATMRWHDTTPQGRMLNRFSKDIGTIDDSLDDSLEAVNSSLANFFASIITIG
jgi:ABC-type multidrug transport system fused ATPase/permease subunit